MTEAHGQDELGVFLRRHDPALPQSPDRLALLQDKIMRQARVYEQETQLMSVHGARVLPLWQRLGMPAGALASLLLGVVVGLHTPLTTQSADINATQAIAATAVQTQTTQEGFLLSPWQNWIKEEPK